MKWGIAFAFRLVDARGHTCTRIIILSEANLKVKQSIKSGRGKGFWNITKAKVRLCLLAHTLSLNKLLF